MNTRLLNYPGCKIIHLEAINEIIDLVKDVDTYIEPFCGTASVLLNLKKDFERKIINDLSIDIIRVIKSYRDGEYSQILDMYDAIDKEFGVIKGNKENFYNWRNTYNERYYRTNTIEEGFYLSIVSRAAINSMFRVGPSGFNQSYGDRTNKLAITEDIFNNIKNILLNTVIYNENYKKILEIYDAENVLFFLDPPYEERKVKGSYKSENIFSQKDFINNIKILKGKIIYTDIFNQDIMDKLGEGWNYKLLKAKRTIAPNKDRNNVSYQEAIYYNF